ncbi:glycosyltransferase family 10 domain-containing protein [Pseudomonas sp.]|uniref:glycosyltransferase family 10 fucosyltransferase n=1 Tax=Pseudomonas sp. TaxID=306 RepID=UPI0028AA307E|nr:glycosyltransferase family 10 [Pseudomonas sp.]
MRPEMPPAESGPLILFYNAFFGEYPDFSRFAGETSCRFTADRARLPEADAVIFHLPAYHEFADAPKYPGQLWVGWSMESRAHTPIRNNPRLMRHFDIQMNFEPAADVRCTYFPKWEEWQAAMALPPPPKIQQRTTALFQSASKDTSGRNAFAAELMRHLPIDSYGRFLNNSAIPQPDRGAATKMELLGGYRFCLALENTFEEDYVTEKFFQPLLAGCVPVYRGAANVESYAPGDHCYIDATAFETPRSLAMYLRDLAHDEAAYARYFDWRSQPLRPAFVAQMDLASEETFCLLAQRVARLLQEQPRPNVAGKPCKPFGWLGYARSHLHRARQRIAN